MAKQREVIGPDPSDAAKVRVRVTVDDRGTDKVHEYSMLRDMEAFKNAVLNAKIQAPEEKIEQGSLNWFFDKYDYSLGLEERASVREAIAAESTIITVDGKPVDLMSLPVNRLVFGINGAEAMAVTGKKVPGAFAVAKKKLIEDGKARLDAHGNLELTA